MTDIVLRREVSRTRRPGWRWAALVLLLAVLAGAVAAGRALLRRAGAAPAASPGGPAAEGSTAGLPPPPAYEPDPALAALAAAETAQAAGDLAGARTNAFQALDIARDPAIRARIEDLLGRVHVAMVFSPHPMEEKQDYVVVEGDSIGRIARAMGTTDAALRRGNGIRGSLIRPGDRFRVLTGRFAIDIDKSANDLLLKLNDRFFKRYRVGTGQYGRTPAGEYRIVDKIAEPPWTRPEDGRILPFGDTNNVLGTRWLKLDVAGYGIHGTWEPETIGRSSSAGCVRLLNADVEELFDLVPHGTPVRIVE